MLKNKTKDIRIVMVIASRNFRDREYFVPKGIFEDAGIMTIAASDKSSLAMGTDGGEVGVDITVEELNPDNFDAVVFVGGPGALKCLDNENSYKLAKETISKGKVLASICVSPVILAKAGVLAGKRATVWSSPMDKSAVEILKENGAKYINAAVVDDGIIVTADGPVAAEAFAEKIIEILTRKEE